MEAVAERRDASTILGLKFRDFASTLTMRPYVIVRDYYVGIFMENRKLTTFDYAGIVFFSALVGVFIVVAFYYSGAALDEYVAFAAPCVAGIVAGLGFFIRSCRRYRRADKGFYMVSVVCLVAAFISYVRVHPPVSGRTASIIGGTAGLAMSVCALVVLFYENETHSILEKIIRILLAIVTVLPAMLFGFWLLVS